MEGKLGVCAAFKIKIHTHLPSWLNKFWNMNLLTSTENQHQVASELSYPRSSTNSWWKIFLN